MKLTLKWLVVLCILTSARLYAQSYSTNPPVKPACTATRITNCTPQISTSNAIVPTGSIVTALINVKSVASTPYTIETTSTAESKRTAFVCTVSCTLTLPAATVGKAIAFIVDSSGAHTITVVRAGGNTIIDTTGTAYVQAALAATAGTSLALICIETGKWTVVGVAGTVTLS